MLRDWMPQFCSRLRIFISYASQHRPIAEKIAQTLKNSGHRVFFDKDSLPPGGDYNDRIRKAIAACDRFVFLVSRDALEHGKYTLTELDMVRQRWPSPVDRVLPVLIDPDLKPEALPTYLSSVQALSVAGNAPAEIAAALNRTASFNSVCWACLGLSSLALAGVAALASGVIAIKAGPPTPAIVTLVDPTYVHFRPRARPPADPSAPDADTSWTSSPLTVTLPISYLSRNAQSAPAQIVKEEAELTVGDRTAVYRATYVVDIRGSSVAQSTCGDDWLCVKANTKVETLAAGATLSRETMFLATAGTPLSWRDFIDGVLAPDGPANATVTLKSEIVSADSAKPSDSVRQTVCRLDLAASRQRMIGSGFVPGKDPRPPVWQPFCQSN